MGDHRAAVTGLACATSEYNTLLPHSDNGMKPFLRRRQPNAALIDRALERQRQALLAGGRCPILGKRSKCRD